VPRLQYRNQSRETAQASPFVSDDGKIPARANADRPIAKISYYGSHRQFVRVRMDLLTSAAWLLLTPSAQIVLLDWIAQINEATNYGEDSRKFKKGFKYSFNQCRALVSRSTFYRAIDELIARQFLYPHPDYETGGGYKTVYCASNRWRRCVPTAAEMARLQKYSERRRRGEADPALAGLDYVTGIAPPPDSPAVVSAADGTAATRISKVVDDLLGIHR
jgi:hypothetical protein